MMEEKTESELRSAIDPSRVPEHVALIMDGNGRWAKQHGQHRLFGHTKGVESVRETLIGATEIGIQYLTLYAFSTENWNRPRNEVDALMNLLVDTLLKEIDELDKNGVQLRTIGDLDKLPEGCKEALEEGKRKTAENDKITLVLALSYSSRWEITHTVQELARQVKEGKLEPEAITEEVIEDHLVTRDIPDPSLLIRTSGEQRISNYLLWQLAYTELYFTSVLWPEFDREELYKAVIEYQSRERRFGMISEQVTHEDD